MGPESIHDGASRPVDRPRPARLTLAARVAILGGLALASWIAVSLLSHAADAAVADGDEVALTEAGGELTPLEQQHRQIVDETLRSVSRLMKAADGPVAEVSEVSKAPFADRARHSHQPARRAAEPSRRPPDATAPARTAEHGDCSVCSLVGRRGPLGARSLLRALDGPDLSDKAPAERSGADDEDPMWEPTRTLTGVSTLLSELLPREVRPVLNSAAGGVVTVEESGVGVAGTQPMSLPLSMPVPTPIVPVVSSAAPVWHPVIVETTETVAPSTRDGHSPSPGAHPGLEITWFGTTVQPAFRHCLSCRTHGEPSSPRQPLSPFDRPVPADVTYVSGPHAQMPLARMSQPHPLHIPRDGDTSAVPYVALNDMIAAEEHAAFPD